MTQRRSDFQHRYGPWALIAGASEGLGEAFAEQLASRGVSVVLLARRAEKLKALATHLETNYPIQTRTLPLDLADQQAILQLPTQLEDLDLGLIIYNAAYAPVGDFLEKTQEELLCTIDVNVRGPLLMVHTLAPRLISRGRGGLVIMSSLAGLQGSPRIATYAASKAFGTVLAESLWGEFKDHDVDVIASCAGAIRTPNYQTSGGEREAPGILDAAVVARKTLDALGSGPRVVPGFINKLAQWFVGRLFPRSVAVKIMKINTKTLT